MSELEQLKAENERLRDELESLKFNQEFDAQCAVDIRKQAKQVFGGNCAFVDGDLRRFLGWNVISNYAKKQKAVLALVDTEGDVEPIIAHYEDGAWRDHNGEEANIVCWSPIFPTPPSFNEIGEVLK